MLISISEVCNCCDCTEAQVNDSVGRSQEDPTPLCDWSQGIWADRNSCRYRSFCGNSSIGQCLGNHHSSRRPGETGISTDHGLCQGLDILDVFHKITLSCSTANMDYYVYGIQGGYELDYTFIPVYQQYRFVEIADLHGESSTDICGSIVDVTAQCKRALL